MSIRIIKVANGVLEDPEACHPDCCFRSSYRRRSRVRMACSNLFRRLNSSLSQALCLALKMQRDQHCPMATLNQMHRHGRPKWPPASPGPMNGCPQLKAVVLKTMIRKPKKPNSANRKCCRVRLSTGREAICFIPGEGHTLQEHHVVMVQGGRTQDLPGIKLKVVRGKYDCGHVQKKK
ncbi:small ribosomal subunit protein uS12m isoform X1 [Petaurus breviceps papuanus]|uniref:small ribosomal subunit protein uS12m isoform X1 n=2 Tax=Petaurus breviceps papuanus TaxID=3040969 RepID=UPI0036DA5BB6